MVRELKSVINYIQPDKIDPDGTLYYFPFKIVPLINLINASNSAKVGHDPTLPLNFVWQSIAGSAIVTFQIMTDPTDEYLPVGDLCFNAGTNDGDDGRNWWQNDYLQPILNNTSADILNAKVLFVKNNEKYCKLLKDSDFNYVADDDDSGNHYDLKIWAATSRNSTTSPQQVGNYVILSELVSRNGSSAELNQKITNSYDISKPSTKVRKVVAVDKNYIATLTGYTWTSSSAGTGDWKGISGPDYVSYSTPFINTFFTNAGRDGKELIFYDIIPESVARTCCSDTQTLSLLPYCKFLKNDQELRCQTMMNTFCNNKTLETPECGTWCAKDGVYCDDKLLDYCKNVDLNEILKITSQGIPPSSTGNVIKPSSYQYGKVENYNVDPGVATKLKNIPQTTYDNCKLECDKNYECDVFTQSGNDCNLYKNKNNSSLLNSDSTLIYSKDVNTSFKNRNTETIAEVQKRICSCYKDDDYYKNYIQQIASKYPKDVQNMLLLSTSSRDKRCFYPECTGGYSLQHKNFRENESPCGDNNIQICFQNIQTSGASLKDSSIDSSQVNNCRMQVQSASTDSGTSTQNIKKYTCDNETYMCVESDFGTYNSIEECNSSCTKPQPEKPNNKPPQVTPKETGLSKTAWIAIIVAVVVVMMIIIGVVISM